MEQEPQKQNFGDKALSTAYKVGGWSLKLKAIGSAILGVFAFVGGIVLAISAGTWGLLIISAIGIVVLIGSWLYWKRAKSLVQGRYY